jgi:four helix bundle protein
MDERPHKRLECWKKGIEITKLVYETTGQFPKDEIYGLTSQMRRAAVSIPSNISEGAAKNTKKEFIQFLYNAQGSLSELDTQLTISDELGYIDKRIFISIEKELNHENKLITGLIKALKRINGER